MTPKDLRSAPPGTSKCTSGCTAAGEVRASYQELYLSETDDQLKKKASGGNMGQAPLYSKRLH